MKLQSHLSSMLLSRGDVREHSAFNVIPCVIYEYIRTIFKADGNCVVDGGFSATKFLKKYNLRISRLSGKLLDIS